MDKRLYIEEWQTANDSIAQIEKAIGKLTNDDAAITALLSNYKEWIRKEKDARKNLNVESWDDAMRLVIKEREGIQP